MGLTHPYFPIDEAYLIGGWLESFFWGLFTFLFGLSIYGIYRKRRDGFNKFTTASIVTLYILATVHMALALVRLIQGFILFRDTIGTIPYFANISVRLNMAKDYIYITNLAIGDLVIAWRAYVVWGKNIWVAVPPVILVIGEFICGYGSISQWLLPNPNPVEIAHWGQGIFVISLAVNIVVTAFIAVRIWYMTSHTREFLHVEGTDRYSRVILLIVESGALIALAKIVEFTLFKMAPVDGLHGLNALYVVYEIMPQVTGIAPTVIVYAVNNGFTQRDDYYTTTGNTKSTLVFNSTRTALSEPATTSTLEFADPKDVIPEARAARGGDLKEKNIKLALTSVSDTSSPV
ncbi:hypothetical protein L227DRAFT_580694 [Lentinus tigrinus ALCF2SS1-6]|uniref:RTA1-domain-containing protein n=1 Tax=Lentinus tigrinus ALCF2SS1-6 TaxID=1328759 RepID=A0A5C2RUR4_9APHY|nr:hypothetical protein L227DRAFT_580694 [Lentinus tigrinus ALCF2SS1-6]